MKHFFLTAGVVMLAFTLTACGSRRSEKDIEQLVKAEYQHRLDSMKLAEAEARAEQAESNNSSHKSQSSSGTTLAKSSSAYGTDFDWLSERHCTYNDIAGLSAWDLCVLRNSIYARHGRKFKRADLRNYFSQFSWYNPRYSEVKLTSLESQNVAFIKSYE